MLKRWLFALALLWPSLALGQMNTTDVTPLCSSVVCTSITATGLDFATNNPLFVASGTFSTLTAPLGLSYWVKVSSSNFSTGFTDFISNRGTNANQTGWEAYWRTNTDIFNLKFGLPAGTTSCGSSGLLCGRNTLITIPPNTWKHVCVYYSTTLDVMYVNGEKVDQRSTGSAFSPNTSYVKVGETFNQPFAMRDIRIRQGAGFTQLECQQLLSAGIDGKMPTTGLLAAPLYAWWPMNDCTGGPPVTLCPDHSGHSPARDLVADAAPSLVITAPGNGATVVGTNVTLTATCTDLIGCNSVSWSVDGASVGSSSTAPYTVAWNSQTGIDRSHVISASATNAGGNTATTSITVTSNNSIAGINWYFSPVGNAANDCKSPATACPATSMFGAPGTRRYLEDDTINFDAGNGPITLTTTRIFLDATSNAYPAGVGHPIIIQSYGGTGSCIPLAGQLGQCAKLQLDPSSTLNQMTFLSGLTNIVERNLYLVGGTPSALLGTDGTPGGVQWFNNLSGANFTFTNNQTQDWAHGAHIHAFTGSLNITETNNFLTGTTVASVGNFGTYMEGHNTGVFQSNVCSNIAGHGVASDSPGDGTCFLHNRQLSIFPTQFVTVQDNASHDMGANNISCGGPAHFWGVNNGYLVFQFDEGWNMVIISGCDGLFWDSDLSTSHNTNQYGYAHHNTGQCMSNFNGTQDAGVPWNSNTMRYNICETSLGHLTGASFGFSETGTLSFVYSNTIYSTDPGTFSPSTMCLGDTSSNSDFTWANNVCVRANSTGNVGFVMFGFSPSAVNPNLTMKTNDYYSVLGGNNYFFASPTYASVAAFQAGTGKEQGSIQTNPLLTSPGGNVTCYSGTGVPAGPQPCPSGYKLTGPTSPVIGTGTNPAMLGSSVAVSTDYYLNAVPNGGSGSGWNMGSDGAHH